MYISENDENKFQILAVYEKESYRITFSNPEIENIEFRKAVYGINDIELFGYNICIETEKNEEWSTIASVDIYCGAGLLEFPSIIEKARKINKKEEFTVEEIDDGVDIDRYYYYDIHTNCTYKDYFEIHKVVFEGFGSYMYYTLIIGAGNNAVKLPKIQPIDMKKIEKGVFRFINSAIESYMTKRNANEIQFQNLYMPLPEFNCVWVRDYSEIQECYTGKYRNFFRTDEILDGIKIIEEDKGKEIISRYQLCKITQINDDTMTFVSESFNYELTVPYGKIVELNESFDYKEKFRNMTAEQIAEDMYKSLSIQQMIDFSTNSYESLCNEYCFAIRKHYQIHDKENNYPESVVKIIKYSIISEF